jgi:hypothetical protein
MADRVVSIHVPRDHDPTVSRRRRQSHWPGDDVDRLFLFGIQYSAFPQGRPHAETHLCRGWAIFSNPVLFISIEKDSHFYTRLAINC